MSLNHTESLGQRLAAFSLALLFMSFFATGCSTTKPDATPEPATETAPATPVAEAPVPAPETATETATNKTIRLKALGVAFLEARRQSAPPVESIEATGLGLPAPHAGTAAEKRLTAMAAARYRALANLVETRDGLVVSRDARTIDMAFAGEEVRVRIDGELKGVSEVAQDYDAETEMATVTLKMPLESKTGEQQIIRKEPLSLAQRKARAVAAARIQATASLREQIGQVYVEQDILVEELVMAHQHARVYVQGLLEGVSFSEALWLGETRCEVVATLEVDKDEMEKMTEGAPTPSEGMGPPEVQ